VRPTSNWWQDPAAQDVLTQILQEINAARASREGAVREKHLEAVRKIFAALTDINSAELVDCGEREFSQRLLDRPETRLAVYGSLAPGEKNHWVVEDLHGSWEAGFVQGTLENVGWGGAMGYPGMTWVPGGERFPVKLFISSNLPDHWDRLDEFEGQDYRRILVPVYDLAGGVTVANIYEVRATSHL
jgi:gamma-glutamylcyclotransferase (GGCT)/AIG2-like uncharacterized protein YtfP